VKELPPERVAELVSAGEVQLVDVRTDEEYEAGHVADARHIPLDELALGAHAVERSRPVVLYCRTGDRSRTAAEAFATSGWDASSMEGGFAAWAEHGLPVEPEGGEVVAPSGLPPR
jgi:rhodanese-related sulfurtransferase